MSQAKSNFYVIVYAGVVCMLCGLLLAVATSALKKRQDYNKEIDRKSNVLKAFGVAVIENGERISGARVEQYFTENVSERFIDPSNGKALTKKEADNGGNALPLYVWTENGEATKYAFPISGKGLWSTIKGYLALEKDLVTIAGVTFYEHGETPGLGGEVETDWFQGNFKGKKIWANGRLENFEVVKGQVSDRYPNGNDHAVDGISGATLTGNGVMRFLNEGIRKYDIYFSTLRKG